MRKKILLIMLSLVMGISLLSPAYVHAISEDNFSTGTPGEACNGGTCTTEDGDILSCPTSGGPVCDETENCTCECYHVGGNLPHWNTRNKCVINPDGQVDWTDYNTSE